MIDLLGDVEEARTLALAIVNTIPDPFLVLDGKLRVLAGNLAFYTTFNVDPQHTRGCPLYELGDGQWNIPALRVLLETIIPKHMAMDGFEVEHDFPSVGRRVMLLNARQVLCGKTEEKTILLAFKDVTARRQIEREKAELLFQTESLLNEKRVLLRELQHRVGNSLQIVASILLLQARAITTVETRRQLEHAYERVMSVAAVQSHLQGLDGIDRVEVDAYLSKLCASLNRSMVAEDQPLKVQVLADSATITSSEAVSLGLIVTELVINAIKHAFLPSKGGALISVAYEVEGLTWKLTVSDNGTGISAANTSRRGGGLGTGIVDALVKQLGARMEILSDQTGLTVSIASPTFVAHLPQAA